MPNKYEGKYNEWLETEWIAVKRNWPMAVGDGGMPPGQAYAVASHRVRIRERPPQFVIEDTASGWESEPMTAWMSRRIWMRMKARLAFALASVPHEYDPGYGRILERLKMAAQKRGEHECGGAG